jgi:hypothetical protein
MPKRHRDRNVSLQRVDGARRGRRVMTIHLHGMTTCRGITGVEGARPLPEEPLAGLCREGGPTTGISDRLVYCIK